MSVQFVDVPTAKRLIDAGARIVDARATKEHEQAHLPDAAPLDWQGLRDGRGRTGRLTDDDRTLAERLSELGIEAARPVLVYGAALDGSGQEGRIAWMLAYLGVREVALLDGGMAAWRQAGMPIETGRARKPARSSFRPRRRDELRATADELLAAPRSPETRILDVRSDEEWQGAMPHFEPRGGRIPGAQHLEWKQLLDDDGRLLAAAEIDGRLARLGIHRDDRLLVYCAGGVRAAFAWSALRAIGWPRVSMYDASFLEWSKRRDLPVAHERRPVGRRILEWTAGVAIVAAAGLGIRAALRRAAQS